MITKTINLIKIKKISIKIINISTMRIKKQLKKGRKRSKQN